MKQQAKKTKFRKSKEWKDLRTKKSVSQQHCDPITNKRLYRGCNLHHLDMRYENYFDISNYDKFVLLNKQTHEMLHFLYRYYKDDPEILERVKYYLDQMVTYNNNSL